jgi:hypothetical protein
MPDRSSLSVRRVRTWRSSSTLRLLLRLTTGLTEEMMPPPPTPVPAPVPAASSSPPLIVGRPSGTTRAMPSATTPIRRPVRTGATGSPGSRPGPRDAPPKTRPHWDSRSRLSASSIIR